MKIIYLQISRVKEGDKYLFYIFFIYQIEIYIYIYDSKFAESTLKCLYSLLVGV